MKIPPEVTLERERKVWELRQRCWTQQKIADELDITQSAVSQILGRLYERYNEENMHNIEQTKIEMIGQLEFIAYEAFLAWENTKGTKYGNVRYLNVVIKAKEEIRKILGIGSHAKAEMQQDPFNELASLSDEELIARAQEIINSQFE